MRPALLFDFDGECSVTYPPPSIFHTATPPG